jgi:hypothetical protein
MISLILIILSAFFNAVMDATENENYFESIFRNRNQKFWYKRISWQYAKKIFGYKVDAWHLSKSCMIICALAAVYCEQFSNQMWHTGIRFLDIGIDICIAGAIWNLSFKLFYHKLFKVK